MTRTLIPLLAAALLTAASAQQPGKPLPAPMPTLRTGTRLVVVNVSVADTKGHPIHGLKSSDFALLEDGVSQQLTVFEDHTGLSPEQLARLQPMPHLPPNVYTNFTPAPAAGSALNVLLIDRVDTALNDQANLRNQLLDYISHIKPGTRVAIFVLSNRLIQIQGFTDDPALLRGAVEKKAQAAFTPVNRAQYDQVTLNSIDAIHQLARYLSGIPGRKNLIWFADTFPLNPFAPEDNGDPTVVIPDTRQQFIEISDLLTQSQVAVYPVEATGLQPPPSVSVGIGGRPNPQGLAALDQMDHEARFDNHAIMREIADSTGGRAFYDTNGLTDAVDSAISDGSNYYTLAYTPANPHWDGSFRHIQVVLRQPLKYHLQYRHGYYALDSSRTAAHAPRTSSADSSSAAHPNTLNSAMMPGSPQPTQLIFDAKVTPVGDTTDSTLAPRNEGSPGLRPPFRRYGINFDVLPHGMRFQLVDGVHHGQMEFVAFVFDSAGTLLNAVGTPVNLNFNASLWPTVLKDGIPFHEELSLPAQGHYFIRLAVHDLLSDHIGAIEVPVDLTK